MKTKIFLAIFLLCCLNYSCFKEDNYNNPSAETIINFTNGNQSLLADAKTTAAITVKISEDASPDRRKVVFKTSLGNFQGGAGDSIVVIADSNFIATANLLSVATGTATVSASIQSIKAKNEPKITFTKAFPESISVSVDSFVIYNNYNSEVLITAALSRPGGAKPSKGHPVSFQVTDAGGVQLGAFLNGVNTSPTNNDGKALIRYSAGPVSYMGFLTITASTLKEDGTYISANTQIYLSH